MATRTSQLGTQKSFDIQKESLNIAAARNIRQAVSGPPNSFCLADNSFFYDFTPHKTMRRPRTMATIKHIKILLIIIQSSSYVYS